MVDCYRGYGLCVGVLFDGVLYRGRHRYVDGLKHYGGSGSVCVSCVELVRKLRVSRDLSLGGLELELLKEWGVK